MMTEFHTFYNNVKENFNKNIIKKRRINEIRVVGFDKLVRNTLTYEGGFKTLSDVAFFSIIVHLRPGELADQELHE